jgi:hypothetical protein
MVKMAFSLAKFDSGSEGTPPQPIFWEFCVNYLCGNWRFYHVLVTDIAINSEGFEISQSAPIPLEVFVYQWLSNLHVEF